MAPAEIALGDGTRAFGEQSERTAEMLREHDCETERREQREEQCQREGERVEALQRGTRKRDLLIVAVPRLQLLGILLQLLRHRLDNLEQAQGLRWIGAVHGHDDPQHQALIALLIDRGIGLLQAGAPQRLRRRRLRRKRRARDTGHRQHGAGRGEQRPAAAPDEGCPGRKAHRAVSLCDCIDSGPVAGTDGRVAGLRRG